MATYSSNEIIDIIFVFDEAERNYCRTEILYRNIRLDDIQMQEEFYYDNVEEYP